MTDALFLIDSLGDAKPGASLTLSGPEGRHAATVKRIRVGERVYLADGQGSAVHATTTRVGKDEIEVSVDELLRETQRAQRVIAVQALAKGDRSDIAIEMLTELGVDEIWAWQAARSVARWDGKVEKALAKWRSTVRESAKQARRFSVPAVRFASTVELCELFAAVDLALILHEDAPQTLRDIEIPQTGRVVFVVGPEGGISPDEVERLQAAGGQLTSLGEHVLRASTAGAVCLAQLQVLS